MIEIAGMIRPIRNTVSRSKMLARQPDSPATARMPADSAMRPEHLHHAEIGAHLVIGARLAVVVGARDHLGGHRVGDHVLDHGADHDQHGAEDIEPFGLEEREPAAGGAGERHHAGGRERLAPIST